MTRVAAVRKTAPWALISIALAAPLVAQHDHQAQPAAEAPQPSPQEQAMMAAMEKAMTPGPQHADLAAMAGSWEFTGSFWGAPDQQPIASSGTAERSMILGGRVIVEKVTSEIMGMPFEGLGMTGYDNVTGRYWSTWTDNMSTGVMTSTGSCENSSCEFTSTASDPMTGQLSTGKLVSAHEADREVHAMYLKGPDGKEWKSMELIYTRRK